MGPARLRCAFVAEDGCNSRIVNRRKSNGDETGRGGYAPKLQSSSEGDESEQQKKKMPPASTETETDRIDDEIAEL